MHAEEEPPCDRWIPCPERYCHDYSQYVPRGHYTYNKQLENYFRSVMWLGQSTFLNRSSQSTRASIVLLDSLKSAATRVDEEPVVAVALWRRFFRVIGTFVGGMDDLNAAEIDGAIRNALGGEFSLADLDDDAKVALVQEAVNELRDPEILSGFLGASVGAGQANKGLRLLGQVFLPDSFVTGQLVFHHVGASPKAETWPTCTEWVGIPMETDPETFTSQQMNEICEGAFDCAEGNADPKCEWFDGDRALFWNLCRGMPSGLDVAAAFGSATAKELALERSGSYAHYSHQLDDLISEIEGFSLNRWGLSISWTWLYAIQGLLADVAAGMPAFMRTAAWQKKTLETGLTSWVELRHDTVLYAKQSQTAGSDADTDTDTDFDFDYVEPQPEAYSRLGAAARRLQALASDEDLFRGIAAPLGRHLNDLINLFDWATHLSVKEVEGTALTDEDIGKIRRTGGTIYLLENKLLESLDLFDASNEPDPDRLKTTMIADVHTWARKEEVLEVGSGYLKYITVLHQLPNGRWGVAVGPAFSYHEFEWNLEDRLTDEAWREMLSRDPDRDRPDWLDY